MPPPDTSKQFPTFQKMHNWLAEEGGVSRKHLWSAILGVALILLVSGFFLTLAWRGNQSDAARISALEALRLAQAAETQLARVETAQRNYLLTRQPKDLQEFTQRRVELQQLFVKMIAPLKDTPGATDAVRDLNGKFEIWQEKVALPELDAVPPNRQPAPPVPPATVKITDDLREAMGNMVRDSSAAVEASNSQTRLQRHFQFGGLALLATLAISFLIISSISSYRVFRVHLRKAESALAQTHSIITTTQDGVIVIDDQGCIQSINPAGEKMFGQKADAVLRRNISVLIPQRLFFHDLASVGRGSLMAMGQRQGYYPFPIEISLSEMRVDGRRQFCALVRDVTERKRGEETLKHIGLGVSAATGEEFVRSLLKQLSKALDNERAFLVELIGPVGTPAALLTIAERGELRSTTSLDLTNSVCSEVLAKGFRAYLSDARKQFPEDALLQQFEASAFVGMPLTDHRGEAIGVMGVLDRNPLHETQIIESTLQIFAGRAAAEIERKRSEEALAAEKERLAVTLRSIADGCITLDNDGRVLMLNPVAERLTGWNQNGAAGMDLSEVLQLLDERTRKPCQHALSRIVATGTAEGMGSTAVLIHRDGTERLVESNSSPIRDSYGRKVGVVIVLRDVTERLRLDEERQKAEKLESLGLVAGGIAHDFNNILTAILGNITLAMGSNPNDVVTERLGAAKKATARAQDLARQLLTFAKGGAPILQTTSLRELLSHTATCALTGSRTVLDFHLPPDLWPVEADPGQIAQVIANFTANAEQAMPSGGTLRFSAENLELAAASPTLGMRAGRWVRFSCHDEGVGIPEQYLKKIFDPYFTTKPKGSGLGLATAYSIIKNHSGLIHVESKPGAGSTFTVCIPASDKQPATAAAVMPVVEVPSGSGRILVLDDEEAICMLVTCALEPLGYEVTETQDALTAIGKYEEAMQAGRKFDLVISDLTIPGGMGGQEAIQRLQKIDPQVRAIVSSGYANDPVMSRFEEFGFSGMIAKPYEIDALGRKVAEIMAQPARSRVIYHEFDSRRTA